MTKKTRNLTLDSDIDAILARSGNASAYVQRLTRDRTMEWRVGLSTLSTHGWTADEIRAACEVCQGILTLPGEPLGPQIAKLMFRRRNEVPPRWKVTQKTWLTRARQIEINESVAHSFWAQLRESWSGNEAWEEALDGFGT